MSAVTDLLAGIPLVIGLWAAALGLGVGLALLIVIPLRSTHTALRWAARTWVAVTRGIPPLVVLFVFFFGVALGTWRPTAFSAATIALGLVASGYLAEIFREGLDAVPTTQREAATALGVSRWTAMRWIMLPQALPLIAASTGSYAIHLLKDTALASLIGVVEITYLATYEVERGANGVVTFLAVGLLYLILSVPIALAARRLGRRADLARSTR